PWHEISADFWGQTLGEKYVLVIIDNYSQFLVVQILNTINSDTVIPVFDKVYSMFGIPKVNKQWTYIYKQ
ncbi:hypothetical protein CAPTEDRAFT_146307, partial [Capitella teleta]